MTHVSRVTNEKSRDYAADFIAGLNVEGKKAWRVTVEPARKQRTLDQNSLYHRWVGIIANDTGNSHDAIHEHCKREFLPPLFYDLNGETHEYRASTTKLETQAMADFMDQVLAWAASDLAIVLPLPPTKTEQR